MTILSTLPLMAIELIQQEFQCNGQTGNLDNGSPQEQNNRNKEETIGIQELKLIHHLMSPERLSINMMIPFISKTALELSKTESSFNGLTGNLKQAYIKILLLLTQH